MMFKINKISILFAFFTILIISLGNVTRVQAACQVGGWQNLDYGMYCPESHGCGGTPLGTWEVDCFSGGVNVARGRVSYNVPGPGGNCECPGGSSGVINPLIVLHPGATSENVRYTENGCPNGRTKVTAENGINASNRRWVCEGDNYGGHLEYTSTPDSEISIDIRIDANVPAHTRCDWVVMNSNQAGSDDTTDGVCNNIAYIGGNQSYLNAVIVRLINDPTPPPGPLDCPDLLTHACDIINRTVTLSWEAEEGSNAYGLYINKFPYDGYPGTGDHWAWPLRYPTDPSNQNLNWVGDNQIKVNNISLNTNYQYNVQATRLGENGSSGACAANSGSFRCDDAASPNCNDLCVVGSPPLCGTGRTCWDPDGNGQGNCRNILNPENINCEDPPVPPSGCVVNGTQTAYEQCDDNNNQNEDGCDNNCRSRTAVRGNISNGVVTGETPYCSGTGFPPPNASSLTVTIEGSDLGPANNSNINVTTRSIPVDSSGNYVAWVRNVDPTTGLALPNLSRVGSATQLNTTPPLGMACPTPPENVSYHYYNNVPRNQSGVNFIYNQEAVASAYYQFAGGLIYSETAISSNLPSIDNYFSTQVINNILTASIPWSGTATNEYGEGKITDRGANNEDQQIDGSSQAATVENYITLEKKFSGQEFDVVDVNPGDEISDFRTDCDVLNSNGYFLCKYDASIRLLILDADSLIEVGPNEKYIIFVEGNLEIDGANVNPLISVAPGGLLMFVVNGNMNVSENVGFDFASTNPDVSTIEGVYIADTIAIPGNSNSTDKQFVGFGTFIANDGPIILGRDLGSNTAPAEFFKYRPDFLLNLPDVLKTTNLNWQEVN